MQALVLLEKSLAKVQTNNILSWEVVNTYHYEDIVQKLMQENSLDRPQALVLFDDTKKFLFLCNKYVGLSPTKALDDGWHTFVLFTREYADFCQRYLGKFIHHVPTVRYEGSKAHTPTVSHAELMDLAILEFGDNLSANWKAPANAKCCSGGNCSNNGTCSHCTSQ